jgi:leucyl aminopeptidase
MDFTIKFTDKLATLRSDCLVIGAYQGGKLGERGRDIDVLCDGTINKILKQGDLKGKLADTLMIHAPSGLNAKRLLILGLGKEGEALSPADLQKLYSTLFQTVGKSPAKHVSIALESLEVEGKDEAWQLEMLARQGEYSQYKYHLTKSDKGESPSLEQCTILATSKVAASHKNAIALGVATAKGANEARELGNLPGNICTPSYLADYAESLSKSNDKMSCSVLGEKKMATLGMHSLLSVGKGSAQESKLIVLEYKGAAKSQKPVVLVGKGITFDTGGISLKPGSGMDEMKFDMCGAATVLGTMRAIAEISPKINVIAIVAAAENMPSDRASKPGDIVTSMSGKTIEILNTDAEGRLVLCDALTYAERFKPAAVVDVATLTGACVVALGKVATGLYANQQALADELLNAGEDSLDRAWQMPLWSDYQSLLDSNFADMANIGGPHGGSITAACFLSRFTENYHWAHLDIAGTAWHSGANKGATGRPVPMLTRFIMQRAG